MTDFLREFRVVPLLALLFHTTTLFAQDDGPPAVDQDKPAASDEKPARKVSDLPDYSFKIDGLLFTGYELNDYDAVDRPDENGPTSENAGFRMGRAYLNFRGAVKDGEYAGWGFRITTDIARSAELGDGCGSSCSEDNDYAVGLKYGFVQMPVPVLNGNFGKHYLRLGLQHTPTVDAQGGVSLQKYWGHRYVDRAPTDKVGMSSSADAGLAYIFGSDYVAFHVLLGNGEGYHHTNAEELANTDEEDLATGAGDSYALDFYSLLSIVPTGKNRTLHWSVNFPLRVHNVHGISDDESRYLTADVSGAPNTFEFVYMEGDTRAKRDLHYGVETDVSVTSGEFTFTLGVGNVTHLDRRGAVTTYNLSSGGTGTVSDSVSRSEDRDAIGWANYVYAHARWRYIGVFGRVIAGTSTDRLSSRIAPVDGTPWIGQALALDAADNQFGNLSLASADANIDHGEGRYFNTIYGVTFFPSATGEYFRISLGVSELRGRDQTGREYRTNVFERFDGSGASTPTGDTIAEQLEGNSAVKGAFGYGPNETLVLNDFVGSRIDTRQVFIRAQLTF